MSAKRGLPPPPLVAACSYQSQYGVTSDTAFNLLPVMGASDASSFARSSEAALSRISHVSHLSSSQADQADLVEACLEEQQEKKQKKRGTLKPVSEVEELAQRMEALEQQAERPFPMVMGEMLRAYNVVLPSVTIEYQ